MKALDAVGGWPVGMACVAVLDGSGLVASVGPDDVLPWASVTKLASALAALVAVDRGPVGLDDPAGPPGSTVRHLLAHASGLAPDADSLLSQPGRRRIYSNRGFEVLADHVVARTGTPFPQFFTESVLRPLNMMKTELRGSPAWGVHAPLSDLVSLAKELLTPTIAPALQAEARVVQFPGLTGVLPGFGRQEPNDWGLGFEIRDGKKPHWTGRRNSPETFGHFGQSGSFLWVDPVLGLACACLTDRQFGDWAIEAWPLLSDSVIEEYVRST